VPVSEFAGFDVDVQQTQGVVVVRPRGELDLASAPILQEILTDLGNRRAETLLDLSELTFIDSTGLRVIMQAYAVSRRDGFGLTLAPGPENVMRLFALTGLADELPFRRPPQ
jgi:anti-sigma B factor antagonist